MERAQKIAALYGAKVAKWSDGDAVAGCWIDRILWLPEAAKRGELELEEAIEEANRYAG